MDSSTIIYLAIFFFILGAGIVGLAWIVVALTRGLMHKGEGSPSQDKNLSVLARLLRDLESQELVVEMDGKPYRSVGELTPAQQRRLGFTAGVLTKWLTPPSTTDGIDTLPLAEHPESASTPETAVFAEQALTPEPVIEPLAAVAAASAVEEDPLGLGDLPDINDWIPAESVSPDITDHHVPPFTPEPTTEVKPVSTQIPDVVGGILNPTPAPAPVYKSIAMQINDILQARISGTTFAKRGLTVSDGPDHGVLVTLDGKKYPGVKDVPDDDVRSLIRSSVLEWEKQSKTPSK